MAAWRVVIVALTASLVAAAAQAGLGSSVHEFTQFPVPNGAGGIAFGPTGDLWFTGFDRIGRLRAGAVTEFATPTALSSALRITAGPDGNMWFTEYNADAIGRITADGVITEFHGLCGLRINDL